MQINAFEGARRIAKLTAVLWILGWIVAAFFFTPSPPAISISYLIAGPGIAPTRIEENLCNDDGKELVNVTTKKGSRTFVVLCFLSWTIPPFPPGFIPDSPLPPGFFTDKFYTFYGDKSGRWDSPEVNAYTAQVKKNFALSQADEKWIDRQSWFESLRQFGVGLLAAIGGLVCLWAFSSVVGWIVRGFAGIPMGVDKRPEV